MYKRQHVERMLKEMLPGVTINSRLRADDYGKRHFDSNGHLMGDYESAYERRLPDPVKDLHVTKWDWEACMTIPENQWGCLLYTSSSKLLSRSST